jgi:hypothetical protein
MEFYGLIDLTAVIFDRSSQSLHPRTDASKLQRNFLEFITERLYKKEHGAARKRI